MAYIYSWKDIMKQCHLLGAAFALIVAAVSLSNPATAATVECATNSCDGDYSIDLTNGVSDPGFIIYDASFSIVGDSVTDWSDTIDSSSVFPYIDEVTSEIFLFGTLSYASGTSISLGNDGTWVCVGNCPSPVEDRLGTYIVSPAVVPIPAAAWLFGSALLGLGVVKRRKA